MDGFVVHPTYRVKDGEAYVHLFGRLSNGESFLTVHKTVPYFFILSSDSTKAASLGYSFETADLRDFHGSTVIRIKAGIPKDIPLMRKSLEEQGVKTYEADIRFAQRFLIDHDIKGSLEIEGQFCKGAKVDRVYEEPVIKPASTKPVLRVVSIDIETDEKASRIFAIAIYCETMQKVLFLSDKPCPGCDCFKKEQDMLKAFQEEIIRLDPDIITGWNVVDFDLKVIKSRLDHFKIDFAIGRDDERCSIRSYDSFFRASDANVPGRIVLDGITMLKNSFIDLDDYKLDTAARQILGESKSIDFNGTSKGKEIVRIYNEEPEKLAKYALHDAELACRIIMKKNLIELSVQRSLLTGMQLDMVKASIASLDSLYLREARKRGYVCPSGQYIIKSDRIKGGYVRDSVPGIYDYVDVLDYKSLYPSIIMTFNIDPLSFVQAGEDAVVAPNGARFAREDGILPLIIKRLWDQRDDAKKRKNAEESFAVKITMNSFFGVLANPSCRFFSLDIANAITSSGRFIVKKTEEIVEQEFKLSNIYSDTDSIFIKTAEPDPEKAAEKGREIAAYVNSYFDNYINEELKRRSYLELQFEKVFIKFMMPRIRGSEEGAKKRYAGLILKDGKEEIVFTGLEFVRRDWTEIAKKFQMELLDRIFHGKEIDHYIKAFVSELKSGRHDDLLVYRKAIRKDLEKYTKTTPPHVKAARKMADVSSSIISYVMTDEGPEPLDGTKNKIDYQHYIEKQIKPIADSVLGFFDKNFDDLIKGSSQRTLSGF